MNIQALESRVNAILKIIGGVRPLIDEVSLRTLHQSRSYTDMLGVIQRHMLLLTKLRVGYVTYQPIAPGWVLLPDSYPHYGTREFEKLKVDVYFSKPYLEQASFCSAMIVQGHELAHVYLAERRSELARDEIAVDICTMMLGFDRMYTLGSRVVSEETLPTQPQSLWSRIFRRNYDSSPLKIVRVKQTGYLRYDEVMWVAEQVRHLRTHCQTE